MAFVRWLALFAGVLFCTLAVALPEASAQSISSGDPIQEIRIEGNQRIEPETVRSYMQINPGDPFDARRIDQALKNLFGTGLFADVNFRREGGALVVANHSGTLPMDGLMMQVAVHDHHPAGRHLRLLAADLVFMLPVVNELARKAGHTLACAEDAERLLQGGEVVGVMPEGFKGIGKPFSERYKLQRFGRGGFVSTALRAGVPIVPCSIVGAEEIYPMIGNAKTLARLLGFPYFPITPTFPWLGPLGLVPLPSKWIIEFGEPIRTDEYGDSADDDPMLVFSVTDQVRETIQQTLYALLRDRDGVFTP